jgi:hypothetical protein
MDEFVGRCMSSTDFCGDVHSHTPASLNKLLHSSSNVVFSRCRCWARGSRIIQHIRTPVSDLLAPSPHHLHRQDHTPLLDGYGCRYQGSHVPIRSTQQPALPPLSTIAVHICSPCSPGIHYSVILSSFNTALLWHCLRNEGCTSHNKRGRLPVDTDHSDTPPVLSGPRK